MKLSDNQVARFRAVYHETYGEELPLEEARVLAVRLACLYRIIYRLTPPEKAALAKSPERAIVKVPAETAAPTAAAPPSHEVLPLLP